MIKDFIKKEISGWNRYEIFGIYFLIGVICFNSFVLKDGIIAVISAICGLMYTIIAGKGKISCYIFGLTGSGFYGYLSFVNGLFGNCLLYLGYYIPMQIIGIFQWRKHLEKRTNEIYRTKLSAKERIIISVVAISGSLILTNLLSLIGDTNPAIDSLSTVLSVIGMYLTVRRCIEQWLVWGAVNLLGIILWLNVISTGTKVYSTVFMWFAYFVMSIYFFIQWKNKISDKSVNG